MAICMYVVVAWEGGSIPTEYASTKLLFNPLKTSPEYTRAGVYGKCMFKQNENVFNGLRGFNLHISETC